MTRTCEACGRTSVGGLIRHRESCSESSRSRRAEARSRSRWGDQRRIRLQAFRDGHPLNAPHDALKLWARVDDVRANPLASRNPTRQRSRATLSRGPSRNACDASSTSSGSSPRRPSRSRARDPRARSHARAIGAAVAPPPRCSVVTVASTQTSAGVRRRRAALVRRLRLAPAQRDRGVPDAAGRVKQDVAEASDGRVQSVRTWT